VSAALAFALLAGASMATYIVFSRLAAPGIHPAVGAAVITGAAFLVNASVLLFMTWAGHGLPVSRTSAGLLLIVGVAAACADFFTLSVAFIVLGILLLQGEGL